MHLHSSRDNVPKTQLVIMVVNNDLDGVSGAQRRQGIKKTRLTMCFLNAVLYCQQAETATTDAAQHILILIVLHICCSLSKLACIEFVAQLC